jgi:hypothetical protein
MEEIIKAKIESGDCINAGTLEDSNYNKIGHVEGDCYYVFLDSKWYYCQHLSIITGFTEEENEPTYVQEFNAEECHYSDVAEYVGIGQENKMSDEIIEFVESTRTV